MRHGSFGWRELATPDPQGALAFYQRLTGWAARPAEGMDYTVLEADGFGIGGVAPAGPGVRTGWSSYVAVDDVDATAARAVALGGAILSEPADIPGLLRRATVADPEGTPQIVFRGLRPAGPNGPPPPAPGAPGLFGWAELVARDWTQVFDFYAGLFGWTRSFAFTLDSTGPYQVFAHEGRHIGGMVNGNAECPPSYWGHYVGVADAAAAIRQVQANGGAVIAGPYEIPGDRMAARARDPRGALIGFIAPRA